MLGVAFKEWAVICEALAQGRQSLLLRKGGIAEPGDGLFHPDQPRFWLYPTFFHQQKDGVVATAPPLPASPPSGRVCFTCFAEVAEVYRADSWEQVARLAGLHVWSEAAARMKYEYRTPGLWVLAVRVYRMSQPLEIPESPEFAGCKTWVHFTPLPTDPAEPVQNDTDFVQVLAEIRRRLSLTADSPRL